MSKVTAEHAGEPDKNGQFRIVSRTEIIGPNDVCTDSYLIIGASEDKSIVENEYKYIQTRFVRLLASNFDVCYIESRFSAVSY